ncbi:MAG TPA: PAS domain S-box protein, partial [Spirochaetota bacterium]|nr:PAS domain S-box protein [Spirochaetota bacterium]
MQKKYSKAFKAELALNALKKDTSVAQLARKYKVKAEKIKNWQKQLQDNAAELFSTGRADKNKCDYYKKFYHSLQKADRDGIWEWDLKHNKFQLDQRGYTMAGYKNRSFPPVFREFQKRVHPRDFNNLMDKVQQHLQGKTACFEAEFRFAKADQSWMWLLSRGRIVKRNKNKKPLQVIGIHTDITSSKEAEVKYHALFDHTGTATCTLEKDGTISSANQRFAELAEMPLAKIINKKKWMHFVAAADLPRMQEQHSLRRSRNADKALASYEFTFVTPSQKHKNILLVIGIIPGTDTSIASLTDITARKKMQDKLEQQHEHMRITLSSIGDAVIATDKQGKIIQMNETAVQLTGWQRDQARQKPLSKVFHIINAHSGRRVSDPVKKVLKSGKVRGLANHTVLISADKKHYQIADSAAPIRDKKGRLHGVVLIFRDITKEYKTQQELSESEAKYRSIFEASFNGIALLNLQGYIRDVNPAFCTIYGYSREELIGMHAARLIHKDYHSSFERFINEIKKRGFFIGETVDIKKDGSFINVEIKGAYTVLQGTKYLVAVINNITSRRQTAKKLNKTQYYLNNIINSMPSMLIGVDKDLNITHWNQETVEKTGIKAEQALNKQLTGLMPRFKTKTDLIKQSIKAFRTEQFSHKEDDHKKGTIYQTITVYPLRKSPVKGAVIRIDDVTRNIKMQQALIHAEKMNSVGGLAAGMAHELNNPLAGMMQNAALIKNRLMTDLAGSIEAAREANTTLDNIRVFIKKRQIDKQLDMINEAGSRAACIIKN